VAIGAAVHCGWFQFLSLAPSEFGIGHGGSPGSLAKHFAEFVVSLISLLILILYCFLSPFLHHWALIDAQRPFPCSVLISKMRVEDLSVVTWMLSCAPLDTSEPSPCVLLLMYGVNIEELLLSWTLCLYFIGDIRVHPTNINIGVRIAVGVPALKWSTLVLMDSTIS